MVAAMAQVNVTIIGLGKVGTSIGLALKAQNKQSSAQHQFMVIGHDGTPALMDQALKMGALDRIERNLPASVEKADIIFLDLPYQEVERALLNIGAALKPGAVVLDSSPLKLPPIQWAKEYFRNHPSGQSETYIVGVRLLFNPEHVGDYRDDIDAARADLFTGGLIVIAPAADCPEEAVQLVADLADVLQLKSHFADPAELDGIVAAMESMPLLLQLALFRSLEKSKSWDDLRWLGNTSFFLGTYQLGQGDAESYGKLLHQSRAAVLHRLDDVLVVLNELRDVLAEGDEMTIAEAFDDAVTEYTKWERARRTNAWVNLPGGATQEIAGARPFGNFLPFGRNKKQ